MKIGEHVYKLILLDTNALREIVTNTKFAGKGFLETFFSSSTLYAPCFSIYNVIELMPYKDIFDKLPDFEVRENQLSMSNIIDETLKT